MKWRIIGADRATGEEKTITVDADSERGAVLRAKESNLLVEKIEMTTPIPDYKGPPLIQPNHQSQPGSENEYRELAAAAWGLNATSKIFTGLGWTAVALGCLAMLMGIIFGFAPEPQRASASAIITIIGAGISLLVWGFLLAFAGGLGTTIARMGHALRDLTMNSYK